MVSALSSPAPVFGLRDVTLAVDGQELLSSLSFTLAPRQKHVLMGPNGAGKSLTLRLLQGLLAPSRGTVLGLGPDGQAARSSRVVGLNRAMVLQRPVLLRRSVAANLRHAFKVYGMARQEWPAALDHWLEVAGLADKAQLSARLLSGGEQQRLSVVRALAAKPDLLLLDEPAAHLDPAATGQIEALIEAAHRAGVTVLLVTHDLGQARRVADHILFLSHGALAEQTPAAQFFAQPASLAAQRYLAGSLVDWK